MTSARQIAMDALREEERPERERRKAKEKKREKAANQARRRRERKNFSRLHSSPLVEWFPGVVWMLDVQPSYGQPYVQTPTGMGSAFIDQEYDGQNGSDVIRVILSDSAVYVAAHGEDPVQVNSAAEVGRYFKIYWDRIHDSMPDYLP